MTRNLNSVNDIRSETHRIRNEAGRITGYYTTVEGGAQTKTYRTRSAMSEELFALKRERLAQLTAAWDEERGVGE